MSDLRQQFLGAVDLRRETVDVPEWGGPVTVREMTFSERAAYYAESAKHEAARTALTEASEIEASRTLADPEDAPATAERVYANLAALQEAQGRLAALAVRLATIDPQTGARVFKPEDQEPVEGKSPDVLDRLFAAIARLSGLTPGDEAEVLGEPDGTLSGTPTSPSASSSGDGQAKPYDQAATS